jgi:hypothetical protein
MPIVILRPANEDSHKLTCKSFKATSKGYAEVNKAGRKIKHWTAEERPDPTTAQEMLELLAEVEADRRACLVFGVEITERGHQQLKALGYMERLAAESRGSERTLKAVPSRVLPIDIDDAEIPLSHDHRADMRALITWALPATFQAADAVYQFSNSCGLTSHRVKGHLFFMLQEARLLDEVKRLAKADGWLSRIDAALFNPAQVLYTARPQIIGGADPIPVRCGLIEGSGALALPRAPKPKPMPTRAAVRRGGGEETALNTLEDRCRRLAALEDGQQRRQSAYNLAWQIGGFVGAGRLSYSTAYDLLSAAAHANGSTQDHRDVLKEIEKGLNRGQQRPLEARPFTSQTKEVRPITRPPARTREESTQPSSQAERSKAVSQGLNKALELLTPAHVAVVKLPTGVGKTYGALIMAAKQVAQGRSVLFASRDNAKAEAAERELREIINTGGAPGITIKRIESKSHICDSHRRQHYQDNPAEQTLMAEMRREGVSGSHLCDKLACPARLTCSVYASAKAKRELEGELSICTHAMLPHLKQQLSELDERALLIIDEAPAEVFAESIPIKDLEALAYELSDSQARDDYSRWRCSLTWRGISRDVVKPLIKGLEALAKASARGGEYGGLIEPAQLTKAVKASMSQAAAEAYLNTEIEPPKLALQHYRRQHHRLVKPSALRALRGLIASVCGASNDAYRLRYDDARGEIVALERWSTATLPTEADLMILDATAHQEDWEQTCRAQGRALAWVEDESITPHEMPLLWWNTGAYKTRQLFSRTGTLSKRGRAALDHLALFLKPYLCHLPDGAAVGIGTHLKLQRLIDQAQQGEGALDGSTWQRIMGRFKLITGHHYADEVGSNALRSVQYLIIIGTPRFDHAHMMAQGKQLGLSEEAAAERSVRRAKQSLEQWVGRLRHYVEPGKRTIYAGDLEMSPMKGITQSTHAAVGRPTAEHTHEIERVARAAISSPEGLSKQTLYDLGASAWVTRKLWAQLKSEGALEVKKQVGRRGFIILRAPQVDEDNKHLENQENLSQREGLRPLEESAYNNIGAEPQAQRPPLKIPCALSSNGQSKPSRGAPPAAERERRGHPPQASVEQRPGAPQPQRLASPVEIWMEFLREADSSHLQDLCALSSNGQTYPQLEVSAYA